MEGSCEDGTVPTSSQNKRESAKASESFVLKTRSSPSASEDG